MPPDPWPTRLKSPDVVVPVVMGLIAAVLYGLTLCPTVYWYDSAEFAAKAASLGVPHPPGYPLYTLIAHVFTWLPGEPAFGVNLMSLTFGVGSVVLITVLTRRLGGSWAAAVVAGAMLMTIRSFWTNAVVTEVYTPGLFFTLGVVAILERAHAQRRPGLLTLAGLLGGLGVGMHMSIATFGLGYVWLVATYGMDYRRPGDLRRLAEDGKPRIKRMLKSLGAALGGLLIFFYVPLQSFENWDARDWIIFRKNTMGGTFKRKLLQDYDFGERFGLVWNLFVDNLQYVGIALAAVGALVLLARRPKLGTGLMLCALGNAWWFFNYRVPDLDVFYLPSISVACICVGFAADGAGELLANIRPQLREVRWLALALPVYLVPRNYAAVDLSGVTEAAQWGENACKSAVPKSKVLLYSSPEEWRFYSVFIYVQEALQQCQDVEIWKKPSHKEVGKALDHGETIYLFERVERVEKTFRLTDTGGLILVQRRKRRHRRKPK